MLYPTKFQRLMVLELGEMGAKMQRSYCLEALEDLVTLMLLHVTIIGCTSLERLPAGLSGSEQLRSIEIQGCMKLTDLLALSNLRSNVSVWQPNSDTDLYDSDLSSDS
ncbi:unnamed protein product [Linum trigynum]|uniref:Uncharacterized protein n=1 Tax=Linum trigynum TaxID=586398 RepID=A0AAV2D141_9ROSI